MDFDQYKDMVLLALGGSFITTIAWGVRATLAEIRAMRVSIEKLNLTIVGVLSQLGGHETRISRLEADKE